jgi:type VI secretion system secreted protein Hcp
MAQADIYLKIDGIPGDSQDEKHKDEIEVLHVERGARRSCSMAHGAGGGEGKVMVEDIKVTMRPSKASPKLWNACLKGEHVKKAVLTERKAGGKQEEFDTTTLTDFTVSAFHSSRGSGSSPGPDGKATDTPATNSVDVVHLNFAMIESEYRPQKADGSLGPPVRCGYDLKQMRAF